MVNAREDKVIFLFGALGLSLCVFYVFLLFLYFGRMSIDFVLAQAVAHFSRVCVVVFITVCLGTSSFLVLKRAGGARSFYLVSLWSASVVFFRIAHGLSLALGYYGHILGGWNFLFILFGKIFWAILPPAALFCLTRPGIAALFQKGRLGSVVVFRVLSVFVCFLLLLFNYSAWCEKERKTVREGVKVGPLRVVYYHGTRKDVARRIPLRAVGIGGLSQAGDPCTPLGPGLCLKRLPVDSAYFRGYNMFSVYDESRFVGGDLYYNAKDGGLYTQDFELEKGTVHCGGKELRYNARASYYRVGVAEVGNGKEKIIFKRGAFFAFKAAEPLSLGKSSNTLILNIPGVLSEPDFVTYMVVKENRVEECLP